MSERPVLGLSLDGKPWRPVLSTMIVRASQRSGLPVPVLTGPSRTQEVCRVRFAIMSAARARGYTTVRIGRALGGRDHSTVCNGLDRAKALSGSDTQFRAMVEDIGR